MPVVDNDRIIGILDESDLLFAIQNKNNDFEQKVDIVMSHNLFKIKPEQSIDDLYGVFKENYTAIVEGNDSKFYGIITKIDLINYLRLKSGK